jgi:hypothetical protein
MVSCNTKNPNLGIFWKAIELKKVGIFCSHLVLFMAMWYTVVCGPLVYFSHFGPRQIWQP